MAQMAFDPAEHPHRRQNLLTGEWVLVSPHRTKRPWQGQVEKAPPDNRPSYDPTCYLCPGNSRAGGKQNPDYTTTFVFENDFAALLPEGPQTDVSQNSFFQAVAETGRCRVICFNPRHDLTLPEMSASEIRAVVDVWSQQIVELGQDPAINYVQLFENKGAAMGCSNPHPHGQVWANHRLPQEPAKEEIRQREYYADHGSPLLVDYLASEVIAQERIVAQNEHWVGLVPFWAVWPFELLLLPRRPVTALPQASRPFSRAFSFAMTIFLRRVFPIPWAGMVNPPTATSIFIGNSTLTSIHPCCVRPRSKNLWWVMRCWATPSVILRQSRRRSDCGQ